MDVKRFKERSNGRWIQAVCVKVADIGMSLTWGLSDRLAYSPNYKAAPAQSAGAALIYSEQEVRLRM